jgi:hypothetical protein
MTAYASFTFKLRSGIRLGTNFWMKGIKRHNQEQDWKNICTQENKENDNKKIKGNVI